MRHERVPDEQGFKAVLLMKAKIKRTGKLLLVVICRAFAESLEGELGHVVDEEMSDSRIIRGLY